MVGTIQIEHVARNRTEKSRYPRRLSTAPRCRDRIFDKPLIFEHRN
jgi:hypothetical protein